MSEQPTAHPIRPEPSSGRVPKFGGIDAELGNSVIGRNTARDTTGEAADRVLREIDGYPGGRDTRQSQRGVEVVTCSYGYGSGGYFGRGQAYDHGSHWGDAYGSRDSDRRFLPNGGCCYRDLNHVEMCTPLCSSAEDFVTYTHAMLRIVRKAQQSAQARMANGEAIEVFAHNSDGHKSWGSHMNMALATQAYENIFDRKLHYMLYLAAFQLSSIVVTGQGKVGSDNDMPPASYQISARADFFERITSLETTCNRGIINSRDEALCGFGQNRKRGVSRLHIIFYDHNLAHVANYLKFGMYQIVLAMVESDAVNPRLCLDDPLEAVMWSHDPALNRKCKLIGGEMVTACDLQAMFVAEAKAYVASGGCEGIVPDAAAIVALWEDTLDKLMARDFEALAPRLDWVMKHLLLQSLVEERGLEWDSPEIKHVDLAYSSLGPNGLYWAYEDEGIMERIASDEAIERATAEPPANSRDWTRGKLIKLADRRRIIDVDWDRIQFRGNGPRFFGGVRTLYLSDPLSNTKAENGHILESADDLDAALDALGVEAGTRSTTQNKGSQAAKGHAVQPHQCSGNGPGNGG